MAIAPDQAMRPLPIIWHARMLASTDVARAALVAGTAEHRR